MGLKYNGGEFGLINNIADMFSDIDTAGITGIGDDCAVIPYSETEYLVVTTDMLVEDVHFIRSAIPPSALGRKSLTVNLSDVAAMGATPAWSLLSVSLPSGLRSGWVDDFTKGYHEISKKYNVPLIGGDTTGSKDRIVINVVAAGTVRKEDIKLRSGARTGDIIAVTGVLGRSGKGLADILSGNYLTQEAMFHNDPPAAIQEGIWLGTQAGVGAMMDISDGIGSDLRHIMSRSGCGAILDAWFIPSHGGDVELAVNAGEDYELLITVRPGEWELLHRDFQSRFGKPLYRIGIITETVGKFEINNGDGLLSGLKGFSHF